MIGIIVNKAAITKLKEGDFSFFGHERSDSEVKKRFWEDGGGKTRTCRISKFSNDLF